MPIHFPSIYYFEWTGKKGNKVKLTKLKIAHKYTINRDMSCLHEERKRATDYSILR